MIRRIAVATGVASLLAVSLLSPDVQAAEPRAKRCAPDCNELLAKARQKGTVHITVILNAPNLPKVGHVGAPKDEQRRSRQALKDAVAREQQAFLTKLASHKITRVHKGTYTPDISMQLDAAALEAILSYPEVRSVSEPGIVYPT